MSGGQQIIDGLRNAADHATVRRHILDWIRDDLRPAAQMTITPEQVNALTDRICGSKTTER